MNARRTMGRSFRELVENDLDIMPLMNLFVALIPMLLISAVFLNVTVIDLDSAPAEAAEAASKAAEQPLLLAITIRPDVFVIEGNHLPKQVVARKTATAEADLSAELAAIVAAHPDNKDVMIIAEANTRYNDIIKVMDLTRAAGLPAASLLGAD